MIDGHASGLDLWWDCAVGDTHYIMMVSLSQGRLPVSQRHVVVTPLLKEVGLDMSDVSNYRPVSNLGFMSKVIECIVAFKLNK